MQTLDHRNDDCHHDIGVTKSATPADTFDGSRHDIDGLGVFCVDTAPATSARPTVVVVHGIPESSLEWRDVAAAIGDNARMVIPDLPGFGRSDKPAHYDYSLAPQPRLLEALLERVEPEAPIHLAVHDIGGPVGLMWAMRNPDRVASLLILNTTISSALDGAHFSVDRSGHARRVCMTPTASPTLVGPLH